MSVPALSPPRPGDLRGLGWAAAALSLWALSLVAAWALPGGPVGFALALPVFLLRIFACTAVFITAHDAMHGLVCPGRPALNDALGALCCRLYAWFDFRSLRVAHHRHHATPARSGDPDWHGGAGEGAGVWYLRFLRTYLGPGQVLGMAVGFNLLQHGLGLSVPWLLLFVSLPPVLSSAQLFVFGTWLPHRTPPGGHHNRHHAQDSGMPVWLSFVTCLHFGYHFAHHEAPGVPWWRLPAARAALQQGASAR